MSSPSFPRTARTVRTSAVRLAVALSLGASPLAVGTSASAQATKTVPVKTGIAPPSCIAGQVTTVAAMNNTRYGAVINVYEKPSATSQLKYSLGVGLEIKGAVVFTVAKTEGDWLNVNVPVRPNGTTGWIKKSDVHTFQHRYAIRVSREGRWLVVCNAGRVIQTEKVAVGQDRYPTPTGSFFTADLVKPKAGTTGPYGPFAYGLSAFSESPELENWNGGDGRVAIHGTNAPKLLGQPVSHGCIRVANAGITKMKNTLPLGVPVEIL
jgi:lipoprotein-anchoring transpeptidase ErfK/SrfK